MILASIPIGRVVRIMYSSPTHPAARSAGRVHGRVVTSPYSSPSWIVCPCRVRRHPAASSEARSRSALSRRPLKHCVKEKSLSKQAQLPFRSAD